MLLDNTLVSFSGIFSFQWVFFPLLLLRGNQTLKCYRFTSPWDMYKRQTYFNFDIQKISKFHHVKGCPRPLYINTRRFFGGTVALLFLLSSYSHHFIMSFITSWASPCVFEYIMADWWIPNLSPCQYFVKATFSEYIVLLLLSMCLTLIFSKWPSLLSFHHQFVRFFLLSLVHSYTHS